tara:strand:+ start:15887 stop:18814 length:2928 start_codon:yes stop_codon:yes gene_type:complete
MGILVRAVSIISILLVTGLALYFSGLFKPDPEAVLKRASYAFRTQDFQTAKQQIAKLLDDPEYRVPAAMLGAEIAIKDGDFNEAIRLYSHVPDDSSRESYKARIRSGEYYLFQLKQLTPAQNEFQRALTSFPDNATVLERLSFIYGLSSRTWEAIPMRLQMLKQDRFDPIMLYLLAMSDRSLENPQLVTEYAQANPNDPLVRLALARMEFDQQQYQTAESRLQKLILAQPDLSQAKVLSGQILLNSDEPNSFRKWQHTLSDQDRLHPEIWSIEGQWYQKQGNAPFAITSYAEAIKRDATNSTACYQLGQLLLKTGQTQAAERLLEYASKLQTYESLTKVAYGDQDLDAARNVVALARDLGLLWEAYGWSQAALMLDSNLDWAIKAKTELEPQLSQLKYTRVVDDKNPVRDLEYAPHESMSAQAVTSGAEGKKESNALSLVSFEDVASTAGISFQYVNGHVWPATEHKMYEFTGGGVGILDYNGDDWPDIYLTQGANGPGEKQQSLHTDRLFLNAGDGTFRDVTLSAGLNENRFSQGVSIGDVNNDGFADIYVGNIGLNRLYLNNGDGTYSEVEQAQGTADQWTTSCLIADLNGDSAPEIYAVNYLTGPDIYSRVCKNSDGSDRSCMPQNFPGAQDQLFSNLKNGLFQNVTEEAGIQVPNGKGLGIIAADLNGNGYPNLFIANDAVANFYFVNQASGKLSFTEQALLSGLALNSLGRAEACMGIAAGDADSDGLLDLYVTNYFRETNTLYRQVAPDVFVDETQSANMSDSTTYQLGFGTQFLDADLDGLQDLLIVNGHVEDLSSEGIPYQMRPQFMKNRGQGIFQDVNSPETGTFFQQPRLGRGMARLDWNRDGLEEVAVSSLDQPCVLLKNTTAQHGHRLVVHLTGTESNRDAIGATVRVKVNGRTLVRQMTAGDGYQASNQRILVFGLGEGAQIETLEVSWPAGLQQHFGGIAVDQEIHLIEGWPGHSVKRILN